MKYHLTSFNNKVTQIVLLGLLTLVPCIVKGQGAALVHDNPEDSIHKGLKNPPRFTFHMQATGVEQKHTRFPAKYSGVIGTQGGTSLDPAPEQAFSLTATLFAGVRLWKGASAYFNPEVSGGKGVSAVTGIAGFPNGETYRVGSPAPVPFVGRAYFRQDFRLSKENVFQGDDANQLAGLIPAQTLSIQAGKYSLLDLFDNNSISHDPRTDFLNWALMGMGAWDYPADTRGYTFAFSAIYTGPKWGAILAVSTMPTQANGPVQDRAILKAHSFTLQIERKYQLGDQPGSIKLIGFDSKYNGRYYKDLTQSIVENHDTMNVSTGTGYRAIKFGGGINIDQQISPMLSAMARISWNDGHAVTWAFTPIDRSYTAGLRLSGDKWKRKDDYFGIAGILNGISLDHRTYLASGGRDYLIGDGQLPHYSLEKILELYYSAKFAGHLYISPDYQLVASPAYNPDRGPVNFFSLRFHFEY